MEVSIEQSPHSSSYPEKILSMKQKKKKLYFYTDINYATVLNKCYDFAILKYLSKQK